MEKITIPRRSENEAVALACVAGNHTRLPSCVEWRAGTVLLLDLLAAQLTPQGKPLLTAGADLDWPVTEPVTPLGVRLDSGMLGVAALDWPVTRSLCRRSRVEDLQVGST